MSSSFKLSLPKFSLLAICFSCGPGAHFSGKNSNRSDIPKTLTESDAVISLPISEEKALPLPKRWVQSLPLQSSEQKSMSYRLGGEVVKETIKVDSDLIKEERTAQQVVRPLLTQFFKQGNQGIFATEKFNQKDLGILDLIIVVDNSRSMEQEQANLSQRLGALLSKINDSDWRMNIVTTDPKDGCSRAVFKKGEVDLAKKFEVAVKPGTGGSGYEEGIRMAIEGMSCKTADWLRPNSSIAVLFVSDEDNCSQNGMDCKNSGYEDPNVLLQYIEKNLGRIPGKSARVYGIFWEPGTACTSAYYEAHQYSSLVKKTGGQAGSICDADFTPTLNRISADVNQILLSELELKNNPVPASVKVKIDGVERSDGFRIVENRISFDVIPPYGSQIEVSYFHSPTPILSSFPILDLPALETIQIVVNNRVVDPSLYSYDDMQKSIVFKESPSENAEIKFQARKREELKQEFGLGKIPTSLVSSELSIENRPINKYQIVEVNGEIVVKLEQPPKDGEKILLTLNLKGGIKRFYPLSLMSNSGFILSQVYDFDTGDPIPYSLKSQIIEFEPEKIKEGQIIQVAYSTFIAKEGVVSIPSEESLNSLSLGSNYTDKCSLDKDYDNLEAHIACNLSSGTEIELVFQSPVQINRKVDMILAKDEIFGRGSQVVLKKSDIKVFIDQVLTMGFDLEGSILTLQSIPPYAQEVRIEVEVPLSE
jgi:hypothetical protein